ncbi:DBH-like monooxygenase protein 1 [Prionailurus iriomotensis]
MKELVFALFAYLWTWPFIIKSPKQYKNLSFMDAMNKFKWAKKEGLSFNKLVLSLPVNVRCSKTDNAEWSLDSRDDSITSTRGKTV